MSGGQNVEYSEENFRRAAEKTGGVRDKLNGIIDNLESTTSGRGKPWGTDPIGVAFGDGQGGNPGYVESRDNLLTGSRNVAATFGNFYDSQVESANYLRDNEDGTRDGMR